MQQSESVTQRELIPNDNSVPIHAEARQTDCSSWINNIYHKEQG